MSAISPDPRHALVASGNLRRRQLISRIAIGVCIAAAAFAVLVLLFLVYYCAKKGISALSWSFLTGPLLGVAGSGQEVGGIGPALAGSVELSAIATLIALPTGVLTALALSEFAGPRLTKWMQLALELMSGLPPILLGIFVVKLIVDNWQQSAITGGIAMSLLEMPLIAATTLIALRNVPGPLREAAEALGISRWRTVLTILLPTTAGAIVTATILAAARAGGDAALVLFTSGTGMFGGEGLTVNPLHSVPNVPLAIYDWADSGEISQAWGAAFIFMMVILAANIGARLLLRRSERKQGL